MTATDPTPTHPDPAVQALIDNGWLGEWDWPIQVHDLANAVRLVRQADHRAARTDVPAADGEQQS
ncbi:hypothetical protein [Verrucosispora sp. WMMC514]|uniref:hypothetical protein n=1 Tax=Verrucosispora sp. WMMC514 TaxID=3015156 RepID=UPI00248BF863|nr:hypothetical protein [Verrucosispora sp. WMMC514]WBB94145.1 hypothetical protein O7597_14950 [Verrucosispora sp. WMMC514]